MNSEIGSPRFKYYRTVVKSEENKTLIYYTLFTKFSRCF